MLLKLMIDVDALVPVAYLGVKPSISAALVRSLLREIIWNRIEF
jgi:hypothetical protein